MAKSSLVTDFLEKKATDGGDLSGEERVVRDVTFTVLGAASDTTSTMAGSLFYALAKNPAVQRRAQAELDCVVGFGRLPTWGDRESLPYIEAIYREILRYCPPAPLGLPHATVDDDIYNGYFIPKGATVIANVWAMTRDENNYGPNTDSFIPERHFKPDGTLKEDDRILAYGFGRRICVGQYVASDISWLLIASVLACFNIETSRDLDGKEIEIKDTFADFGVVRQKAPFECCISPRSQALREFLEASAE
jgi:cytochrome P450